MPNKKFRKTSTLKIMRALTYQFIVSLIQLKEAILILD